MARTHTSLQQPTASVLNNKNFTYNNYIYLRHTMSYMLLHLTQGLRRQSMKLQHWSYKKDFCLNNICEQLWLTVDSPLEGFWEPVPLNIKNQNVLYRLLYIIVQHPLLSLIVLYSLLYPALLYCTVYSTLLYSTVQSTLLCLLYCTVYSTLL